MSQPSYSSLRLMTELWPVLTASLSSPFQVFWPDDVSLFDAGRLKAAHVHGHRQLTDLYLLALAVQHGGRFVSFDARVPLSAVPGAKPNTCSCCSRVLRPRQMAWGRLRYREGQTCGH